MKSIMKRELGLVKLAVLSIDDKSSPVGGMVEVLACLHHTNGVCESFVSTDTSVEQVVKVTQEELTWGNEGLKNDINGSVGSDSTRPSDFSRHHKGLLMFIFDFAISPLTLSFTLSFQKP